MSNRLFLHTAISLAGFFAHPQSAGRYIAEEGEFVNDEWAGNVMGCSIAEARKAAAQADAAAQMAMAFELRNPKPPTAPAKPAGADATLTTSRQEKARGKFDPGKYLQQRAEAAGQLLQGGRQGLQNLHNPVQDLWEKAQAKFSGLSKPAATN